MVKRLLFTFTLVVSFFVFSSAEVVLARTLSSVTGSDTFNRLVNRAGTKINECNLYYNAPSGSAGEGQYLINLNGSDFTNGLIGFEGVPSYTNPRPPRNTVDRYEFPFTKSKFTTSDGKVRDVGCTRVKIVFNEPTYVGNIIYGFHDYNSAGSYTLSYLTSEAPSNLTFEDDIYDWELANQIQANSSGDVGTRAGYNCNGVRDTDPDNDPWPGAFLDQCYVDPISSAINAQVTSISFHFAPRVQSYDTNNYDPIHLRLYQITEGDQPTNTPPSCGVPVVNKLPNKPNYLPGERVTFTPNYFDQDGDSVSVISWSKSNSTSVLNDSNKNQVIYTAPSTANATDGINFVISDGKSTNTCSFSINTSVAYKCNTNTYACELSSEGTYSSLGTCEQNCTASPIGNVDNATCSYIDGWLVDPDDTSRPASLQIYMDRNTNGTGGTLLGTYQANLFRSDLQNTYPNWSNWNHGYRVNTPPAVKDGNQHTLWFYALDINGNNANTLLGTQTLTCPATNTPQYSCNVSIAPRPDLQADPNSSYTHELTANVTINNAPGNTSYSWSSQQNRDLFVNTPTSCINNNCTQTNRNISFTTKAFYNKSNNIEDTVSVNVANGAYVCSINLPVESTGNDSVLLSFKPQNKTTLGVNQEVEEELVVTPQFNTLSSVSSYSLSLSCPSALGCSFSSDSETETTFINLQNGVSQNIPVFFKGNSLGTNISVLATGKNAVQPSLDSSASKLVDVVEPLDLNVVYLQTDELDGDVCNPTSTTPIQSSLFASTINIINKINKLPVTITPNTTVVAGEEYTFSAEPKTSDPYFSNYTVRCTKSSTGDSAKNSVTFTPNADPVTITVITSPLGKSSWYQGLGGSAYARHGFISLSSIPNNAGRLLQQAVNGIKAGVASLGVALDDKETVKQPLLLIEKYNSYPKDINYLTSRFASFGNELNSITINSLDGIDTSASTTKFYYYDGNLNFSESFTVSGANPVIFVNGTITIDEGVDTIDATIISSISSSSGGGIMFNNTDPNLNLQVNGSVMSRGSFSFSNGDILNLDIEPDEKFIFNPQNYFSNDTSALFFKDVNIFVSLID